MQFTWNEGSFCMYPNASRITGNVYIYIKSVRLGCARCAVINVCIFELPWRCYSPAKAAKCHRNDSSVFIIRPIGNEWEPKASPVLQIKRLGTLKSQAVKRLGTIITLSITMYASQKFRNFKI